MNQISILVIDDVEAIRTFTSLVLKRLGYECVETVDSAELALEKIEGSRFDLILLDINLPSMSGLELLTHLKSLTPNSKVVMCSSSSSDQNIRQAIDDGAEGFLVKPITPTNLISLLHRLGFNTNS